MEDDSQIIEPSAGPYKGQRISVSAAEAKRAIKEKWARDPFAVDEAQDGDDAQAQVDDAEMAKRNERAEAAAKRWRGDEQQRERELQPASAGVSYETRDGEPEHAAKRGRPAKEK